MKQPSAPQSENCLIGVMLKRADLAYPIQAAIEPDDFFQDGSRAIYREIIELAPELKSAEIDTALLADRLLAKGRFINSQQELRSYILLCRTQGKIENLDSYVTEVRDKATLRAMIAAMTEYSNRAMSHPTPNAQELSSEAEEKLSEIFHRDVRRSYVRVSDSADRVGEAMISANGVTGIPTGFAKLDDMTGGLQRKETALIAARPGMGKTALAINIANHAIDAGAKVAFISLEMSGDALTRRAICSRAGVRSRRGDAPPYSERETELIREASTAFAGKPFYIFDEAVNAITLRATAMRIAREAGGLDLVIVDYLQKITGASKRRNDNREQEVAGVSMALTQIAKDLNVAMLALAQLNRNCENRTPPRPVISDLRDSGQIEQDIDLGLLIYREKFYDPKASDTAELIIAKQRDGATGVIELTYDAACVNFRSS